jgi:hypothetical protein
METAAIRVLRAHLERATSNISTNREVTNTDSAPRFFTYSFGTTLFKRYLIINTTHITIEVIQVIVISIFLNFKAESQNLASIESHILPH